MANAQQLTMCTCHIYIKYFALQDQVESDLTLLQEISTNENAADAFIKALSKQLFHRHYDSFMGRRANNWTFST